MRKHNKNRKPLLPLYVIKAAADGDTDAIVAVLKHFEGYMAVLSTRRLYDENGHALTCVDETMRVELENKLIAGIGKFKSA
jgi:regulator of RNase E activity RraB